MRVEVDQSGKIEQTNHDTVLAFANDTSCAVLIPAKVKRELVSIIRSSGKKRRAYLFLFSAAVYELLRRHLKHIEHITIDIEYQGRGPYIKGELLSLIRRTDPDYPAGRTTFARVGKKSAAHARALATYRGVVEPDRTLTTRALVRLLEE